MDLITNNHPKIDLSAQHKVIEVWCTYMRSEIKIYLKCNTGDEQAVYDNLPKWIHDEMIVTKSHNNVFLETRKIK